MISRIKSIFNQHDFVMYTEPYRLNIVGMRADTTVPNKFDDEIHAFYMTNAGNWNYHIYKATTDPGTFWLENPYTPEGTAILAQGQYINAYSIGMHRGLYPALVQVGIVSFIRDYNRDAILDFNNGQKVTGSGFGINIHRANSTGTTKTVDMNSAGCQVFQNADDFAEFMQLCYQHDKLYGNKFTYTLIDFRSVKRETKRRIVIGGSAVCALALAFTIHYSIN